MEDCSQETYVDFYHQDTITVRDARTLLIGKNPKCGYPRTIQCKKEYESIRDAVKKYKKLKTSDGNSFTVDSSLETKPFFKWAVIKYSAFKSQLPKEIVSELTAITGTLSIPVEFSLHGTPVPEAYDELRKQFLILDEENYQLTKQVDEYKPLAEEYREIKSKQRSYGQKSGEARRKK